MRNNASNTHQVQRQCTCF